MINITLLITREVEVALTVQSNVLKYHQIGVGTGFLDTAKVFDTLFPLPNCANPRKNVLYMKC